MDDIKDLERILIGHVEPRDLTLQLLQEITEKFSERRKIGVGGFGMVYKGELQNGIFVAVKRIIVSDQNLDDADFNREVKNLMKIISHRNVVRFLGFCSNTHREPIKQAGSTELVLAQIRERLLCFEYISNGNLGKHITDELRGLDWSTRYDIINGVCHGLHYLHEEKNIIHMDLNTSNIMLDNDMVPKITDFGLSRPDKNTHISGAIFVTRGYCAPEYVQYGRTSKKADIYSLGVIIVELVTGGRVSPSNNDNVLRRWRHRWSKAPALLYYQEHQITRCMEIGIQCRKTDPKDRPSVGDILNDLRAMERDKLHIGQESTYLDDDMLDIEPLELKLNEEMSWSVKLTNNTTAYFAFHIERPSKQYTIRPDKGIVTPGCSECLVQLTLRAPQVTKNVDKFIVRSTKVSEGLRVKDITQYTFHEKAGKVVDEVDLMVVDEQVEAVSPKAINSSSREDCTRGQRDRRHFHPPESFSRSQPVNMKYLLRVSDRAVDVTSGAMGSLLHKLGELSKGEFNLETSMKEDIESLSEELVNMQSSLRKVSEVQHDNLDDQVKLWASNVREMSYDLEDFVDGFLVNSELDTDMPGFKELTHEMCILLDRGKSHLMMHDLIKDKAKKVQDVARKCKNYKVHNVVPNASAKASINDLRSSVIYKDKKELVGIDVPSTELMWLFEKGDDVSKNDLKIVSIVGLGGLGKTTLAKAVYDKLKAQYDFYTFVSLGQNPDLKKVLESIVGRFADDFRPKNLGVLIEKLQELLEYRRYFIVIDDIWDSSSWELINSAFPRNSCGSRVITTTRIHDVAIATCNTGIEYVYKIKPLSEEDSRRLFFRRTFGTKKGCPDTPRKEEISIDILKRCGGMPLAINCMASLLAGKTDSTWEYVRKTLGAMIEGNTSLEGNIGTDNMMQILDLSYIHLPDYLKTCLLHICMYPEDHEVDKNDLLKQWVAEDFIVSTNGGLDAEDVAEMYLKELINRCMVQPGKKDHNNEVVSCRVHDIILDLMRSKSSRDNFSHVIDGSEYRTAARGQIRRVSAHNSDKKETRILETIKNGSLSHVRSVLIYRCRPLGLACFMELRYVRVLHIEADSYMDLSHINGLFLLRYLKVTIGDGKGFGMELPDQIGALQQLETIDFVGASFQNYPSDIVSLPRLSHLSVTGRYKSVRLPDGIERLKSLRTLAGVDLPKCSVENIKGLSKLTNLRTLHIGSSIYGGWEEAKTTMLLMDALHTSISMLSDSLRVLTFQYESLHGGNFGHYSYHWRSSAIFTHIWELDLAGCEYTRCPEWVGQLHQLYKFTIMVKEVSNGMSIVAGLPSLAYLWLETNISNEYMEESIVIPGHGAFQALKHLIFRCSMALLTFETGAMPKLEKLEVRLRYEMNPDLLPVGIQHLRAPTLQEIRLRMNMNPKTTLTSRDWDIDEYCAYRDSDENQENYRQHKAYLRDLFKEAFNPHHPGASIILHFHDDINFGKEGVTI